MSGNPLYGSPGAADRAAPPPALMAYQQAWVADDAPLKIAEKSRRIGLTWAEASDDVLIAAGARGSNVFYISATQDMALEYIEACALWARVFDQAAGEIEEGVFEDAEKQIKTYKIDFPKTGRRIVALSSRPTNLRGKQGVIVIDEAAFHNDLAKMLKAAMAMLLWGDRVRIISTHEGADNPFNELIQEIREGRRKGSVHRITLRDAVAQGLYRRVCLRRGIEWTAEGEAEWVADAYGYYGDAADEELDVIPSQSGGAYLSIALIESRMDEATPIVRGAWPEEFRLFPEPTRRLEIDGWCEEHLAPILAALDQTDQHAFGEDFGRVGDLTVIPVLAITARLRRRVKLWVELARCPFEQQKQILLYVAKRLPRFVKGALDRTGNGMYLAEVAAQNLGSTRIEEIHLTEGFYLEHMPRLKSALEDGILGGIPRDREIRDDLRAIRVINGVPKLPAAKTQAGDGPRQQRHGDGAVGLLLANYAADNPAAPIDYIPVRAKSSRWDGAADDAPRGHFGAGGW